MNSDWSGIGVAAGGGTSVGGGGSLVGSGVAAGAQALTTRENVGFLSIAFSSFPLRNLVKTGFY